VTLDASFVNSYSDLKFGRTLDFGIRFGDTLDNNLIGFVDLVIDTTFVDYYTPVIDGIEINGELVEGDSVDVDPNQYTSILIQLDDAGISSSGIASAIVYYSLTAELDDFDIEDYDEEIWLSFNLEGMVNEEYFNIFPSEQAAFVGFPQGTVVSVVVVIVDQEGYEVTKELTITVGAAEPEGILASQILMSVAGAIVIGSIIYRFLRRKKVKVIDRA
jgi:hypothetical protein